MNKVGDTGTVISVNISEKKGTRKTPVESGIITLDNDFGVHGDAHAGDWHRQVSFLTRESIDTAVAAGLDVREGDFGENITTKDLDLKTLPMGTHLRVGPTLVEISQIGKVCHTKCAIYYLAGDCIFPREGVFGWVLDSGDVHVGDVVEIVKMGDGTCARTPQSALDEFEEARKKEAAEALEAASSSTPIVTPSATHLDVVLEKMKEL
jgi:MOSC domain-containing protein YiiM